MRSGRTFHCHDRCRLVSSARLDNLGYCANLPLSACASEDASNTKENSYKHRGDRSSTGVMAAVRVRNGLCWSLGGSITRRRLCS
jgi:hypothetical protein